MGDRSRSWLGRNAMFDDVERAVIGVNGRVRSVTPTHVEQGQVRFLALVPEESFRFGANRVAVFEAQGAGSQRRLTRLADAD